MLFPEVVEEALLGSVVQVLDLVSLEVRELLFHALGNA
jgi:hypothetical protein